MPVNKPYDEDNVLGPLSSKFVEEMMLPVYPNLKIKLNTKADWIYKIAAFFGKIFNPKLTTDYLTVIGATIWVPESFKDKEDWSQLTSMMHEGTHLTDSKRLLFIPYFLAYFFPQFLAVLSLLSFGAFWDLSWLLWLLCLLFLLPFPAPGRAWIEFRGYQMNMMMIRKLYPLEVQYIAESIKHYEKNFTGPAYYFMWPFPEHTRKKLAEKLEDSGDPWIKKVQAWVEQNTVIP